MRGTHVENGRQYPSYCVVELLSLEERQILSEDEFPPQEVTSQVEVEFVAGLSTDGDEPTTFLRVNDAFDTALWLKQRVDEQRIVVCGEDTIHLLDLAGGPLRQIFPPPGNAGSESKRR